MSNEPPKQWDPSVYSADDLAADLGVTYRWLQGAAARIEHCGYKPFVTRRSSKARVVYDAQPWLADLQVRLTASLLSRLPVADAVYSQRGRDQIGNALAHVGNTHMLVMDVRDCYPSVTVDTVRLALIRRGFSRHVAGLLTRLVTFRGRLPQGAKTSAAVLDCVFYEMDTSLAELADSNSAIYTRFVDDICVSSTSPIMFLRRQIRRVVAAHGLKIGVKKTRYFGPADTKSLTGVVVADPLRATPDFLNELNAMIASIGKGRRTVSEATVRGKIAWVRRLNPADGRAYTARLNRALQRRSLAVAHSI